MRVAVLLFVCHLPWLVEFYPGQFFTDTESSVEQWHGHPDFHTHLCTTDPAVTRTNHHPVIYTVMYGGTLAIGEALGSQNAAMFAFLLVQSWLTCMLLARLMWMLCRRSKIAVWLVAGIYALFPVFGLWSTMLVKDTFFSMCLLLLMVFLAALVLTRGRIIRRRGFAWKFLGAMLLFMLSKNQCFYILVLVLLYALVLYGRRAWRIPAAIATALALFYVYLHAFLPSIGIALSGRQEARGWMFQQTARYVKDLPGEVTAEERTAIAAILPYDSLALLYSDSLQDPVKFRYNVRATSQDYRAYDRAWWAMLLKHPATYARATWDNCSAFFHPSREYVIASDEFSPRWVGTCPDIKVSRWLDAPFVGLHAALRLPVVGLLFDMGFLVPLALLLCLWLAVRRRWSTLFVFFPVLVSIGVLILSPQNGCFRYVMPVIWPLPLLAAAAFPKREEHRLAPVASSIGGEAGMQSTTPQGEGVESSGRKPQLLSVIIPSYNEARTLPEILRRIKHVELPEGYGFDVVLVDDGSTDDTLQVAQQFIKEHPETEGFSVRYFRQAQNGGKGTAIRRGIKHIAGDYVVIQDADLEYDPNDLARMLGEMLEKELDVLYGSRFLRAENKHSSQAFYYGGRLVSLVANLLYGQRLTDEPTCYKMFRSSLLSQLPLRCRGFEFCPEVTALVAKRGYKIPETPISYSPRSFAEGKKINWRDGVEAIWTLLRLKVRRA